MSEHRPSIIRHIVILFPSARKHIEQLEAELAKYKGKWKKEEYRCPQCGTGNPRVAQLEEENERLTEWLMEDFTRSYMENDMTQEEAEHQAILAIDALKEGER